MSKNIIEELKEYTQVNREETFLISYDNKTIFCNLTTLNYLVHVLYKKVKVIANCYCLWDLGFNDPIVKFSDN